MWQDEAQYVVTLVASDLAEMAYYAHARKALPSRDDHRVVTVEELPATAQGLTYRVKVRYDDKTEVTCDLPMDHAIWSPDTYRPLTKLLFEKLQLTSVPGPAVRGVDLLNILAEPSAEQLASLDRKLSIELERAFSSSEQHERAALLLGAFTLREASGIFFQTLVELSRMTSHLAFAEALRAGQEPTLTGRVANAVLTALYNDQVGALAQLADLPEDNNTRPWKSALRMRVTHDYRMTGEKEPEVLLEKIERFRAYAYSVNVSQGWEKLKLRDTWSVMADWARIARTAGPSVEVGHQLLRSGLELEMEEAAEVYGIEEEAEFTAENMISALNADPRRCVTLRADGQPAVRIMGWGLWAAFLQRHLCHTLVTDFDFMQNLWGVPEEAAKYRAKMDELFWKLYLYPFVRRQNATTHDYYRKAQDEEMALVRSRPHVVPAMAWNFINYEVDFAPLYFPPPHPFINEWHKHNPLPGTVYDILPRMHHPSMLNPGNHPEAVARLEQMHVRAPYDDIVSRYLLRFRDGDHPPAEKIVATFGPVAEYDLRPIYRLGREDGYDPAIREKWLRKAAAIDPFGNQLLGDFYLKQGQEKAAAESYQRWIEQEVDDVSVSNSSQWLVDYYERNGQPDLATALADRAADTHSAKGLLTKAALLERRGEFDSALDLHEKQAERYDAAGPLIGFLVRRRDAEASRGGNARYEGRLKALLQEHVPGGLVKFQMPAGAAPPERGVEVHLDTAQIAQAGLKIGDVIVAVRGYAVKDWRSFKAIRGLEPEKPYFLTVWRGAGYREIGPLAANHRFGVDLPEYRKP